MTEAERPCDGAGRLRPIRAPRFFWPAAMCSGSTATATRTATGGTVDRAGRSRCAPYCAGGRGACRTAAAATADCWRQRCMGTTCCAPGHRGAGGREGGRHRCSRWGGVRGVTEAPAAAAQAQAQGRRGRRPASGGSGRGGEGRGQRRRGGQQRGRGARAGGRWAPAQPAGAGGALARAVDRPGVGGGVGAAARLRVLRRFEDRDTVGWTPQRRALVR